MKLSKNLGRIATTFLATAMLASVSAVPAFAEDTAPVTSVPFEKVVTTDGDTFAPNTSFEFEVKSDKAGSATIDAETVTVKAGIDGVLSVGNVTSAPVVVDGTKERYEFKGSITVDASKLEGKEPGIYHYTINEKAGNYEGIDYDDTVYDVYVYYVNNDALTDQYVKAVVVTLNDAKVGEGSFTFTNNYGEGTNDSTHDVIVTKNVEGSLANMSDTFIFDVSVTGATGEAYKVVYTQKGKSVTTSVISGETLKVDGVGNKDTIHIYGLSANDTYTVTENDGVTKGYTVTDTDKASAEGTVTGNLEADNTQHSITNKMDASAPTGIMMDVAPYVLLVAVAAAGCFVFLRKRRED